MSYANVILRHSRAHVARQSGAQSDGGAGVRGTSTQRRRVPPAEGGESGEPLELCLELVSRHAGTGSPSRRRTSALAVSCRCKVRCADVIRL